MSNKTSFKPVLMLFLATAGWGLSFPLTKALMLIQQQLLPEASEWFITAQGLSLRFGMAAVLLALGCRGRWRNLGWLEWKFGLGIGFFAGIGMLLQMVGLGHTLASTSAFLTQAYVLIIPVALALWYRKLPSWLVAVSCLLVVAGMAVLCRVDWRDLRLGRGETLTVLCSAVFVGDILWLDRKEFARVDKLTGSVIMFAVIALVGVPVAWWTQPAAGLTWAAYGSASVWIITVVLVLVPALFSFTMMNLWQPAISPTHASLIYCAEPVFASLFALGLPALLARLGGVTYANETLTANLWIGGGLITVANILVQRDHSKESDIRERRDA
ncbi:MAG: DMT family transporter [Verrucomicrobiota bacterium]